MILLHLRMIFSLVLFFILSTSITHAADLSVQLTDASKNEALANVVITLHPQQGSLAIKKSDLKIMDQIGKMFVPHVLPVTIGTPVSFPNKDNIRHHLYSFDEAKAFELPLYQGTPTNPIIFDKQGVVRLGCNIHDWMMGYIFIVDTPLFAMSDENGMLSIANIPAGEYSLKVWHPRIKGKNAYTTPITFTKDATIKQSMAIHVRKLRKIKKRSRSRQNGY